MPVIAQTIVVPHLPQVPGRRLALIPTFAHPQARRRVAAWHVEPLQLGTIKDAICLNKLHYPLIEAPHVRTCLLSTEIAVQANETLVFRCEVIMHLTSPHEPWCHGCLSHPDVLTSPRRRCVTFRGSVYAVTNANFPVLLVRVAR